MNLTELNVTELQEFINEKTAERESLHTKMADEEEKKKRAEDRIDKLRPEIKDLERKAERANECILARANLPRKISTLRKNIIRISEELQSEDITVGHQKDLSSEREKLHDELKKTCSHPFVAQTRGIVYSIFSQRHQGHTF